MTLDRNDQPGEPEDLLLAYMRGELSPAQHRELAARLDHDAALRSELETLEAVAQIAQEERADATADASFARLEAALGLAQRRSETRSNGPRERAPASREPVSRPWHVRFREWWMSHGNVLQPALIALVLIQSGVIAHYLGASHEVEGEGATIMTRGAPLSCDDVWVTFRDGVTEQQLRSWLTLYGASITAGPDDSGRYRIGTHDADSRNALLHGDEAARLLSHIDVPQGCGRK
ncbi:anti-sigma factor family protein [Paraburkholderia ferrariae]|uniref:anti-sigma factor family protein n=1 Tax=Paraburkholderia ferrariae TaxID=386056 RepID=UPI000482AA69|nr:hypothetical protein [Paraburkholderia ferrariae]